MSSGTAPAPTPAPAPQPAPRPVRYIVFTADVQTAQAAKLRDEITKASNAGNDIYLYISSGGGNVFEGMSIAALIKALPVKVVTHNAGQIDSIANIIFAAGCQRYASKEASFFFHGVSMHYEKADFIESQLQEQYLGVKRMRENIAATYANYIGLTLIDAESLMITGATILTATEALAKKIIHEIRDISVPVGSQVVAIGNG